MKLLQINEDQWINPEMITYIEDDFPEHRGCYVYLQGIQNPKWCDITALKLMSKICEEVYYGDNGICKEDK